MFNNSFRIVLSLVCLAFGAYQMLKGEFYSGALFVSGAWLIIFPYLRKRAMQISFGRKNKN